jgi:alanine dehydrogenase
MIIGVLKENKPNEARVIVVPNGASELVRQGHKVLVQKGAGELSGFSDEDYVKAGAELRDTMADIYKEAEMVAKVKEILPDEYEMLREDQIVFGCLHPAAHPEEVEVLMKKKVTGFTAEDSHRFGSPNCEVAGKMGALMGIQCLTTQMGGSGKLVCGMGGAPGIRAIVLGAGIVGMGAIDILASLGAQVTVMDIQVGVLRDIQYKYKNVQTAFSNQANIRELLPETDLIINAVKWPKQRTDHLVSKDMLKLMRKGSVIVDVSADIGGAIETYQPTTHENPTYVIDGVVHYGVDNIPAAVPQTTSIAYAAVILPHLQAIANLGCAEACRRDAYLRRSLTLYKGVLCHEETALIQKKERQLPEDLLGIDPEKMDKIN